MISISSSAASASRDPASLSGGNRYSRTCSSKTSAIKPLIAPHAAVIRCRRSEQLASPASARSIASTCPRSLRTRLTRPRLSRSGREAEWPQRATIVPTLPFNLQPADCLILLPQRLPAAVETSIVPAHYPAECTQSDAFLQPSLRARKGRANSNSFEG